MDSKRSNWVPAIVVGIIIVLAGVAYATIGEKDDTVYGPNDPEVQSEGSEATDNPPVSDQRAVRQYLNDNGFKVSDFTFGVTIPTTIERGSDAVASQPLLTIEDVVAFLHSDVSAAHQVNTRMRACLDTEDYRRAQDGSGYVRVQFQVPVVYQGNTYLHNGDVTYTTAPREVGKGDIAFIFVGHDGTVRQCANIRSDCGNVSAVPTKPGTPGTPGQPGKPPPGKCVPGSPGCRHVPPTCENGGLTECKEAVPGPTGTGHGQPKSDTQPIGKDKGSPSDNNHVGQHPHPPPELPAPPPQVPPAKDGGNSCATCDGY